MDSAIKKAIAELKIRQENFRNSSKIHENHKTFLLLNFCHLQHIYVYNYIYVCVTSSAKTLHICVQILTYFYNFEMP